MAMARGLRDGRNILLPSTHVEKRPSLARGVVVELHAGQLSSAPHRSSPLSLSPRRTSLSPLPRRRLSLGSAGEVIVGGTSGGSTRHGGASSASTASPSNRFSTVTASRIMVTVLSPALQHRRGETGPGNPLRLHSISPAENVEEDKFPESPSQSRMSSGQVDAAFEQSFGLAWNSGKDLQTDSQVATPQDDFVEACAQAAKAPWVDEVGQDDMSSDEELPGVPAPPSTPELKRTPD